MKYSYKKYSVRREINPAFLLNQIGKLALKNINNQSKYQLLNAITIQLMCSFTMEAVLNHIGRKVYIDKSLEQEWEKVERYEPRRKLDNIVQVINLQIDYTSIPFGDFQAIFTFRDHLVHGKTVVLVKDEIKNTQIDEDNFPIIKKIPEIQACWENNISIENAKQWRASVSEMAKVLSEKSNIYDPIVFADFIDTSGEIKV